MNQNPQPKSRARLICDALIATTATLIIYFVVSAYFETFRHLDAVESAVGGVRAPDDNARLTLLEHRIDKLEAQRREDWRVLEESLNSLTNWHPRVFSNLLWLASSVRGDLDEVRREIATLRPTSAHPSAPMTGKPVLRPALKAGIPAAVYDRIASNAARSWPDDFDMQRFEINRQVEAFFSLPAR
jgi:hypothetical protein